MIEENIVTPDEVVAEVNRIAEVVRSWPSILQTVNVSRPVHPGYLEER